MLAIRVDMNGKIASGHIMRTIAIAKGLRKCELEAVFINADNNAASLLAQNNFNYICLNSDWDYLENELTDLSDVLKNNQITTLIVDSYYVTEKYLTELRKIVRLIYIDDLNTFKYPVDMLINYNNYAFELGYENTYLHEKIELLLGSAYVPLRDQFQHLKFKLNKKRVENILVTVGSSDNFDITGKLLTILLGEESFQKINLHIVVGRFNQNSASLQKLARQNTQVKIYSNIENMAELMLACDLAISAGGSTLYELCACGIPTVCFSFADNQLLGVKGFEDKKVMLYAGDARDKENDYLENIVAGLKQLIANKEQRLELSMKMLSLVDGKGIKRIAEKICSLHKGF